MRRFLTDTNMCTYLTSLSGLGELAVVGGGLFVETNPSLVNIDGLGALVSVEGDLFVVGNQVLPGADVFLSLETVGGSFSLSSNAALSAVTGPPNLISVGKHLLLQFTWVLVLLNDTLH